MSTQECARNGCSNTGSVSFSVRPDLLYCRGCFEYLSIKVRRIDLQMRRVREERRNESEDHRPARQPSGY